MTVDYQRFIEGKIKLSELNGFPCDLDEINPLLKPHQRALVQWAVRGGSRAIFAAFGLGKSFIQLEVMRLIMLKAGGRALITLPLGVRQEFKADVRKLQTGEDDQFSDEQRERLAAWLSEGPGRLIPDPQFIRSISEASDQGLYLTNYESIRDGKLDPNEFTATSLDEASVLRSFGSKTYQTFLGLFDKVPFKYVATAAPSPNRLKELIHYAGFLGIMDTGQALTRWFQRDSSKANNLTLYPHKEAEFWLWVNSWAAFVQRPSDLGFSDEGYELPPYKVYYHEVPVDYASAGTERDGQGMLFQDAALSLQDAAKQKRDSMPARIAKSAEIIQQDPDKACILWHDLEAERHALEKAVPEALAVYGSQDLEEREQRIVDFSKGRFKYLSAKPVIAGSGCNFQRHCHKVVFVGVSHKFNDFIQAIHRVVRFLQLHECEIHIVYAESEREVLRSLKEKWIQHDEMTARMSQIIRTYGLGSLNAEDVLRRTIGIERREESGDGWLVANNDCVDEAQRIDTDSVGLIHTSIPFANHYEYSPSYNDFGHTEDNGHFWAQMDYLTPELLRILQPGRLAAIHVKDRILFGNVTGAGAPTVSPFHAEAIFHYLNHGFDYAGMITVVTDVVRENNQTYRLGWSEQCKDGTKMGVGSPEYILLFRKPQSDRSKGYADERVVKDKSDYTRARWQVDAHAFWRSSGDRLLTADEMAILGPDTLARVFTEQSLRRVYSYEDHVRIGERLDDRGALPSTFMSLAPGSHDPMVWHDVNRMRTLNGEQSQRGLQNHVCPLQFDVVDRVVTRYSNPGDEVFDPFGGLMTVPYRSMKLGRRGRAAELNPGYFDDGVEYLRRMERELATPTLFDALEQEGTA